MILGVFAFGAAPFGAGPGWEPLIDATHMSAAMALQARVDDPNLMMLQDMTRTAVHAIALKAWDIEAEEETTLYFADHEFISASDDTPANTSFDGRLRRAISFSRSMIRAEGFGGLVKGDGTIVLDNGDGRFDGIEDDYALDGRGFEVRVGRRGDKFEDMLTIFTGTVMDFYTSAREVTILVTDRSTLFDLPLVNLTFSGDGEFEGGEDLYLKRNPFVLGEATNFSPPVVWPQKNIYMLNGPDFASGGSTFQVFMNGVELDFYDLFTDPGALDDLANDTNEPPEGWFTAAVDLSGDDLGVYIRLGVVPDNQVVTASLDLHRGLGDMIDAEVTTKAAGIADMAVLADALTWPGEFDVSAFYALHAAQPYRIGLWWDQNSTATLGEAIDRLCGETSFAGFTGAGQLTVGVVSSELTSAALELNETSILEIEKERLPNGLTPPVWRWRLGWLRNWTDMQGRIAGSVGDLERAFFNEPIRAAGYQDSTLLDAHPTARERVSLDDMMVSFEDAAAEGERLYSLFTSGKRVYRIVTSYPGLLARFGETVFVRHWRFGLSEGRLGMVLEDSYDAETGRVTLRVFC